MREGVIASALLLIAGVVLIFASAHLLPRIDTLLLITNTIGIVSLLLAPMVLIATLILTVAWPGVSQRLQDCNH